jgi:hypothetical protein
MNALRLSIVVTGFALASASSLAESRDPISGAGLQASPQAPELWPRLQGRVLGGLAITPAAPGIRGDERASSLAAGSAVLGDLYFSRSFLGPDVRGGFRASSGVLLGTRTTGGLSNGLASHPTGGGFAAAAGAGDPNGALGGFGGNAPYVGVGYSGISARGGWGFTADLGIVALTPGSSVKLGRSGNTGPTLEDQLRELRLSPLLRLGVSYEF